MLVYPKGSSLRCLKRLSLGSGILQVLASIAMIPGTLLCGFFAAMCFLFQDVLIGALATFFPSLLSGSDGVGQLFGSETIGMGVPDAGLAIVSNMLGSILSYVGIAFIAVTVIMLFLSILAIRRATTHLGRNRMLKLFPSGSGLRVYRYSLFPTVLALIVNLAALAGCLLVENGLSLVVLMAIPFLSVLSDLITWIYITCNFDKMMEEV